MSKCLDALSKHLFGPPAPESVSSRSFQAAFLGLLLLVGAMHWIGFFNSGDAALTAHDWPYQRAYLSVARQAVTQRVIPYHFSEVTHGTNCFLAIPETPFTPQLLALPLFDAGENVRYGWYALLNVLFLYCIGFVGCLWIREEYRLSAAAFAVLFLLFNFNGHITAHLGMGHPWYGYFLLPWFCLCVLHFAEGKADVALAAKTALLLFAILLQGSFHIMVWCLMLVALMAIFHRASRLPGVWVFVFTALLGAVRFAPAAMKFSGKGYPFESGYRSLYNLFEALVSIKEADTFKIGSIFKRMGWWEYDLYVGILALAVVVYLGIVVRWQKSWKLGERKYKELDLPLFLLALLSMSYFYAVIARLPLPLANVERASSRFLLLPFLLLVVIACIRMQEGLDRLARWGAVQWLVLPALLETGFELVNHSVRWSVRLFERSSWPPLDVNARIVVQPDAAYETVFQISAAVSAAAFIALIGFLLLRKRTKPREGSCGPSQGSARA